MPKSKSFLAALWVALSMAVLPLAAACSARACIPSPPIPAFVEAGPDAEGGSDADTGVETTPSPAFAVFETQARRVGRVALRPGAKPEDVSAALDALSPGADRYPSAAAGHTLVTTTRFGCTPDCLVLDGVPIDAAGAHITPRDGRAVMNATGSVVAYQDKGPVHERDLFLVRKVSATAWGAPVNVTSRSPFFVNVTPALSSDGQHIVFDCNKDDIYSLADTSICEVGADGGGFRILVRNTDFPGEGKKTLRHAWYEPAGGVVFEGATDSDGVHVYRSAPGGAAPVRVGDFANDASPCVLPDGRIVTHWLSAPVPHGDALKVMSPDGATFEVVALGEAIFRGMVTCSG